VRQKNLHGFYLSRIHRSAPSVGMLQAGAVAYGPRERYPQFQSDISAVLYPLPKLPIMVCFWLPGEGMKSSLNEFFDQTAYKKHDIGSIFSLEGGLAHLPSRMARSGTTNYVINKLDFILIRKEISDIS
jgi:hypothetical protein